MFGSLISALGSLAGGLFGRSAAKDAQQAQQQMAAQNIQLQQEFAQNGIQWRVADAQKAGIHPLAALGAQLHSFSPVSISGDTDTSMSTAVANMGQDIGRAVNATRSADDRRAAVLKSSLDLQGQQLDNDIKRADLASRSVRLAQQANPPMPTPTRDLTIFDDRKISTPGYEATQDQISKEYGDEGLPQIPGQMRFARDYGSAVANSIGNWWSNLTSFPDNARRAAARRQQSIDTHRRTMGRW